MADPKYADLPGIVSARGRGVPVEKGKGRRETASAEGGRLGSHGVRKKGGVAGRVVLSSLGEEGDGCGRVGGELGEDRKGMSLEV